MLNSFELTRRRMLGIIASSLPLSRMGLEIPLPRDIWTRRLEEFLGRHGEQAECGWLNREDLIYHDLSRPAASLNTDPEFCAFLDRIWIFNKAMEWHQRNGCILCCSVGGDLQLTGENQVSRWHSDRPTGSVRLAKIQPSASKRPCGRLTARSCRPSSFTSDSIRLFSSK